MWFKFPVEIVEAATWNVWFFFLKSYHWLQMSSFYEISFFWNLCHVDTHYNSGSILCPVTFSSLWGKELLSIQILFHWAINHVEKKSIDKELFSLVFSSVLQIVWPITYLSCHELCCIILTETQLCLLKEYSTFIASCNRQVFFFFSIHSVSTLPYVSSGDSGLANAMSRLAWN